MLFFHKTSDTTLFPFIDLLVLQGFPFRNMKEVVVQLLFILALCRFPSALIQSCENNTVFVGIEKRSGASSLNEKFKIYNNGKLEVSSEPFIDNETQFYSYCLKENMQNVYVLSMLDRLVYNKILISRKYIWSSTSELMLYGYWNNIVYRGQMTQPFEQNVTFSCSSYIFSLLCSKRCCFSFFSSTDL